jgi:ABC-type uncharacterized transport system involved in gliding motility auxiliary subunit
MFKMNSIKSSTALLLVMVLSLAAIAINEALFSSARIDLTEDRLYSLSDGSRNILAAIDEPVTLTFYYSDKATKEMQQVRAYAKRITELLNEYEVAAGGNVIVELIDPESFSEQEDQAVAAGMQGIPTSPGGPNIYFGLAGSTSTGKTEVLPALSPDREEFLEYDISKLIYKLGQSEAPIVGVLSTIQIDGGRDMRTGQPTKPWAAVAQLEQLFRVKSISPATDRIDDDVSLLLVMHPNQLSAATLFAIDQYVLAGGHAIVMVDPVAEQDASAGSVSGSDIPELLKAWGVQYDPTQVLADNAHAMRVNIGRDRPPVRHPALLSLDQNSTTGANTNFPGDDMITRQLEKLHISSAGILSALKGANTRFTPLIQSSSQAGILDAQKLANLQNPESLLEGLKVTGERYVVAARISGPVKTAFPDGKPKSEQVAEKEGEEANDATPDATVLSESATDVQLIIIADTDIFSDRLWVQVQEFFGQQVATPFADNGNFMINSADNLMGSSDLIGIRSRGQFYRPFHVVEQLRRDAEDQFRLKEEELMARLNDTEAQLAELQQPAKAGQQQTLNAEQQAAIDNFVQKKLSIRKELREVRHQLDREIEGLGTRIKLINTLLVPLLLTLLVLIRSGMKRARIKKALES